MRGLQNNIGSVRTEMDSLRFGNVGGTLRTAYDSGVTLIDLVRKIPTNVNDGAMAQYAYNDFATGAALPALASVIPTLIGSSGPSGAGGGIINASYTALLAIN